MTATTSRCMRDQTRGDGLTGKTTLPCILNRLSRLEHEGFSYDDLLHNFASRRRVGPVNEELPVKHLLDPAEEIDEIVQVRDNMSRPLQKIDVHPFIALTYLRQPHQTGIFILDPWGLLAVVSGTDIWRLQ